MGNAGRTAPLRVNVVLCGRYVFAARIGGAARYLRGKGCARIPRPVMRSSQLIRLPTSDEEDRPASESASSRFARWLAWSASDAFAMRISCLIATLNPMTEITNPARLIQSPTLIFTGSSALIIEKGKATVTLFLGDTTLGAERDLRARAVPLSSAISQPPISQTDGAARCQAHRRSATTADCSVSGVVPKPYIRRQPRRQRWGYVSALAQP